MKTNTLAKQLFELLKIHSPSGQEFGVLKYLLPITNQLGEIELDDYGNLYITKRVGDDPYTVLLSAHMDTVAKMPPAPTWRNNCTEIFNRNARGALGGDDKCGIAAILEILREVHNTSFTGTLKVLFSREEEIGCVGAGQAVELRPDWFRDVKCAVVIDRRGNDNVINGTGWENFCSPEYAEFWQGTSKNVGFESTVMEGSISDTMIFAGELGINGVNLSAGYYEAHTSKEHIKIEEVQRAADWVLAGLSKIQAHDFPEFQYLDTKAKAYYDSYYPAGTTSAYYLDTCDLCQNAAWNDELIQVSDKEGFAMRLQVCTSCYNLYMTQPNKVKDEDVS